MATPTPGSRVVEAELTWALAEVAGAHLDVAERNNLYVAIGIGETFFAIGLLTAAIVRNDLAISGNLVTRLHAWLDSYCGHDDELRLRDLIGRMSIHARGQP